LATVLVWEKARVSASGLVWVSELAKASASGLAKVWALGWVKASALDLVKLLAKGSERGWLSRSQWVAV
jgi:hypothetical protein